MKPIVIAAPRPRRACQVVWLRSSSSATQRQLERVLMRLPTPELDTWIRWVTAETLAGRYTVEQGFTRALELAACQRCWCGAPVYNSHHCTAGHLQTRRTP